MTQLNEKKRDDLKALLEDHQNLTDAIFNLGKSTFYQAIIVAEEDGGEFTQVDIRHGIAKKVLTEQKKWIDTELKKLGVEII